MSCVNIAARGGFGRGRGDRGRGRGRGRGRPRDDDKEWVPITKLGRLVKENKIKSLEDIYLFSMAIKGAFCVLSCPVLWEKVDGFFCSSIASAGLCIDRPCCSRVF